MTNLWQRLCVPYSQWPWPLVALVDTRLDDGAHGAIAHAFLNCKTCCLDRGFSQPLQGVLETKECLIGKIQRCTQSIVSPEGNELTD